MSSGPLTPARPQLTIIGGGLAGCEAAWQAANRGLAVTLYEMKPQRFSAAHQSADLAELVCSNSLRGRAGAGRAAVAAWQFATAGGAAGRCRSGGGGHAGCWRCR